MLWRLCLSGQFVGDVNTSAGMVRAVLPPTTWRDFELPMGPIPALGEHTEAIPNELGYAPDEITELEQHHIQRTVL